LTLPFVSVPHNRLTTEKALVMIIMGTDHKEII